MPSDTRKQQKFMYAQLEKREKGQKTQVSGMSTAQIKEFTKLKDHHKKMGDSIKKLGK
jgi:hypothetical protein